MEEFEVRLPIQLGQFVKLAGLTETGGQANEAIADGAIFVNGSVETRRRHQLVAGDVVSAIAEDGSDIEIRVVEETH